MQFLLQFVLDICDTYNAILYDLLKDARFLISCGIVQYCINKKVNIHTGQWKFCRLRHKESD